MNSVTSWPKVETSITNSKVAIRSLTFVPKQQRDRDLIKFLHALLRGVADISEVCGQDISLLYSSMLDIPSDSPEADEM